MEHFSTHSEHLVESLEKLSFPVRRTLEIITRYYMDQLAPEHFHAGPDELAAALAEIRRTLNCCALVSELSEDDQSNVLAVLSSHVPNPLTDERPGSRIDQLDTILQEVSIGLICWHARTAITFALFEQGRDHLPDYERFRHGDYVIVGVRDWQSYPYHGCTGTFQRYSDPRISHDNRWAIVHLDGDADDDVTLIRPDHLEFAPYDETVANNRDSEQEPEADAWCSKKPVEAHVAQEFEQLRGWRELHLAGATNEAILAVARYGRAEDIFEVLALDIFEAYDLVLELAKKRDDQDLHYLLRQLHRLRNIELVGGEDELANLYE